MKKILPLLALVFPFAVVACHPTDDIPHYDAGTSDATVENQDASSADASDNDSGVGSSVACYVQGQDRCHEYPEATADQQTNMPVECSSDSGNLTSPANCPTNGFLGKCTLGTGAGRDVTRWYAPADAAYQQDFCVNTSHGVWSTTF